MDVQHTSATFLPWPKKLHRQISCDPMTSLRNSTRPLKRSDSLSNSSRFFRRLSSEALGGKFQSSVLPPLDQLSSYCDNGALITHELLSEGEVFFLVSKWQYVWYSSRKIFRRSDDSHLVYEYLLLWRLMSSLTTGLAEVEMSICSSRAEVISGTRQTGSTSRSRSLLFRAVSQAVTKQK